MKQFVKRTLVLVPLLALLAAPAQGFGQSGRSWSERKDVVPANKTNNGKIGRWFAFSPLEDWILNDWRAKAAATGKWHTNDECKAAMGYTRATLAANNIQAGLGTSNMLGEYFEDVDTVVVHGGEAETADGFGTLIHESWHRGTGATDDEIKALNVHLKATYDGLTLESCHDEAREEEDDDEPGEGGSETPEEPTTPTCTDQQVWVTWTEWERVEETTGEWVAVPGNPFDVNANDPDNPSDSGVHYVPVVRVYYRPVTKGEWQTQRVCSS